MTRQAAEQRYRPFTAEADTAEQATLEAAYELCDARIRFISAEVGVLKAEHGIDAAIPTNCGHANVRRRRNPLA